LSWEERKRELLEQLESESSNESGENPTIDAEMQRILAEKNQELASREQEIRELRNLVEQQSISQNGFAIGAAAVADIVEADDLIIAERMKLREMQHEWEQKQRQSEIEMSLERAKLARERLELQDKLRELQQLQKESGVDERNACSEKSSTKPRGNWFARLGLKDD
jgi:N-methylhydantoinase A/oxoprolinase/acetone carboxylase beta subunit